MVGDAFEFIDIGPLVDGDLELVAPRQHWVEEVLSACSHPLTRVAAPEEAKTTRQQLNHFLRIAPLGRDPGDPMVGRSPQYQYWMRLRDEYGGRPGSPPVRMLGGIGLRLATTRAIEMYYGHFGYHVYPPARGRHYAERACRLLLPLARAHGMKALWITCNPDNFASRTTCERLGAKMVEIVAVPQSDPLYARGERHKCRYRLDLGA